MDTLPLEALPAAASRLPVPVTRSTARRWLRNHPGLGVQIGGRLYLWREAVDAIATGTSLAEAAKLAGAGRDQRAA